MTTIGLDFGTTNSVVSELTADGALSAISFATPAKPANIFPSLMTFWQDDDAPGRTVNHIAGGQWAVEAFRDYAPDRRLIKSFKTFAANPHFANTNIYGKRYDFSELLTAFLRQLGRHAQSDTIWQGRDIIIGRPVEFAGRSADENLALKRYHDALNDFGFGSVRYVYEPVAAAYYFLRDLQGEATLFVGDFGGGTSDYSIIKAKRQNGQLKITPLVSKGLGIAGDQFDHRIIQNTVAKAFGKGSLYRSFDKKLEIPPGYFNRLSQWSEASILKDGKFYRELVSLQKRCLEPEKIGRFMEFVSEEMVYQLIAEISKAKQRLSTEDSATISLEFSDGDFEAEISRQDFEQWIAPDMERLDGLIVDTLAAANVEASDIDLVFLSGGTSFVPAISEMFKSRLPQSELMSHDQLTSVAQGLALIAHDPDFIF